MKKLKEWLCKHSALVSGLFLFAAYLLLSPSQTIAQSRLTKLTDLISSRRTSQVQVSFTYSPANPSLGQNVQFVDTSTNNPTSWRWSFGDGTSSTDQNPIHAFSAAGFYRVSLTATNKAGSKVKSRTISVMPAASTRSFTTSAASFKYSPSSPVAGRAVQFTDTSTNSPTSWKWHFGDGMTSTAQSPTHPYGASGLYIVTLDASNSSETKTANQMLTVAASSTSTASFTFSPASPVAGQAVQFTDTSTGSPTSWQWNFGDGTTSASQNPSHIYTSSASYTVTLTATNSSGSQSVNQTVTVVAALAASFTYSPASPAAGQAVQFTDTSTGSPTSWQWSFGDGSTSTAQNPSHTFATAASFTVTLTATNSSSSQSVNHTVAVVSAVSASFTYSPSSPVAGQAVQFTDTSTGSPTSWQWNFGDGSTSTTQNPSHTFTTAASYTVTLTVNNASGSKNTNRTVTVVPALAASFTYSPASPAAGQAVQFTDTSTGSPTSWQWSFGDGATNTTQNPSHTFATAASYTVTLTVTNASGSKNTTRTVTVIPALVASFTYSPASPVAGQAVQFTDTSIGSPTSWQWSFGDGATNTTQNPSHTFTTAGSYSVTLTATNITGSKNVSRTITVVAALTASFTFSPASPVAGQAVQFTDTSIGSPTSWQWDFGDGSTSTAQNPSHTYSMVATYNVTLAVGNSTGSKSTSQTINVLPSTALIASFTYSPASPATGQAVQFTDTSTGSPTSWQWDFGDGTSSTAQNPNHTYTAEGSYLTTLTIRTGASLNNASKTITVAKSNAITAASPSFADVSTAIALANPGDTVVVPAGAATWASTLVITKGINLVMAGIDNTTITNGSSGFLIQYYPSNPALNEPMRISGFSVVGNSRSLFAISNPTNYMINNIRIDHISATGVSGLFLSVGFNEPYGCTSAGCMDNCTISGGIFRGFGRDSATWTNVSYEHGTQNNWYIEDCNITTSDQVVYCESLWYALRHNVINASNMYPMFDAHGNQTGNHYSTVGLELSNNTINGGSIQLLDLRGGRALVYNNTISGSSAMHCREEFLDSGNAPAFAPNGEPQHVNDTYVWNNTQGGSRFALDASGTLDYGGSVGVVPRENVHFWNQQTSFNGTMGVGVGLRSARPASCTAEGVAYWATDEQILYRWHNGAWETYYTPCPYPHPLRKLP